MKVSQHMNDMSKTAMYTIKYGKKLFILNRTECETNPGLNDTKELYEENRRLRRQLEEQKKELAFLKKAAAFFAKEID